MKRLMKNGELFTLKCTTIQAFICSLPYLLPPVTKKALHVCVRACVRYGASCPRKADRRCATHIGNFSKTVGLLPVHSFTLNQPQSATYLRKCLQPRLCVCQCVWLFICLFVVSLCDCFQKPFFPIQLPIVEKSFMITEKF